MKLNYKRTILIGLAFLSISAFWQMYDNVVPPILSGFLLENISYRTLFPYAVVFSILPFCTMSMVKHWDVKPVKKESLLENFDVED